MKSIEAVKIRLKQLIKDKKENYNSLCVKSCLSPSTLKTIFYKDVESVKLTTISLLCSGLGITLQEFFNDDIFKDIDDIE